MNHEEQRKKTSPTEKLPAGKDDKAPVPAKPAALSDEDLDNVAGGNISDRWGNHGPGEEYKKIASASSSIKK